MRDALVVLATLLVGCASPPAGMPEPGAAPEVGERYISIGADAVSTARALAAQTGAAMDVLDLDHAAAIAVLVFDAEHLETLSEHMHEEHHRCGGFVLHDSLEEARASLHDRAPARPALDYTLDRAEAVTPALAGLQASAILETIRTLSAMPSRHYQSASGAAASLWLRDLWRGFTTRPDVTVELFDHGYAQQSVILTIPGSTRANEVVVIGGHLDSITMGRKAGVAPGADDDASGIATLTEVARVLLAKDFRPERTVKFMAYAAEEVGLRGSQGIVRDFMKRKVDVVGALQLDMTNYQGSEKDIWLMKDFTSAAQNTFLTQLIDTYVGATWGLDACGYACSDHATWYRAGVPASMPFEARMSQRNRAIHTQGDTLEVSGNNAAHALKFARLAAAYAIELGKGELGAPDATAPLPVIAAAAPASVGIPTWRLLAGALSLL
ncbi:MAG: M20/M25/M40 family metallo-hydrolase, partial [Myxococcota bacterium]|nr:M20/M25/M40 family metallo-hydrolase [Myxococcota bacterium]